MKPVEINNNNDDTTLRTLVHARQLTCLQANQRLIELSTRSRKNKKATASLFATRLIDCTRFNTHHINEDEFVNDKEQNSEVNSKDSTTNDHNRSRKDERRLDNTHHSDEFTNDEKDSEVNSKDSTTNDHNRSRKDERRLEHVFYELVVQTNHKTSGSDDIPKELKNGGTFLMQLKKDHEFISPGFLTEHRFGDLYADGSSLFSEKLAEDCFYSGHLLNDGDSDGDGNINEEKPSVVTLNICRGLVSIQTDSDLLTY